MTEQDTPLHPAIRFDGGRVVWLNPAGFRDRLLLLVDQRGDSYGPRSSCGDVPCEQCGESLTQYGSLLGDGVRCEFCCTEYRMYWLLHDEDSTESRTTLHLREVVRIVEEQPDRRYVYLLSCGHTVTRTMKAMRKCACEMCGAR